MFSLAKSRVVTHELSFKQHLKEVRIAFFETAHSHSIEAISISIKIQVLCSYVKTKIIFVS